VIDRAGAGGPVEAEAAAQLFKDTRVLCWSQVEVAAEEQWRLAGPPDRGLRRFLDIRRSELGLVVGRVQVGDADTGGGTGERHRPPLRPALVDRQLASLDDPAEGPAGPDQGQVRAALARGDQVGIEARRGSTQCAERVA
jgi:hypothetical protein